MPADDARVRGGAHLLLRRAIESPVVGRGAITRIGCRVGLVETRYVDRPWRRACATQRLDRSKVTEVIYQVCFRGVPSPTLRAAFDDCTVEVDPRGATVLRCTHDALPLVLTRIQDLGLELVDVAAHDGLDGLDG